jgi:hypothetical protein
MHVHMHKTRAPLTWQKSEHFSETAKNPLSLEHLNSRLNFMKSAFCSVIETQKWHHTYSAVASPPGLMRALGTRLALQQQRLDDKRQEAAAALTVS